MARQIALAALLLLAAGSPLACGRPTPAPMPAVPALPDLRPAAVASSPGAAVRLEPGQVARARGGLGGAFRAFAGERYAVVLTSGTLDGVAARYQLNDSPARGHLAVVTGCSRQVTAVRPPPTPPAVAAKPAPKIGSRKRFSVRNAEAVEVVEAEVVAVGDHTVVWADVDPNHPAQMDAAFVSDFLHDFEATILKRGRSIFGHESDIDGDGRIALLFTPLTYRSSVAYFSSCDLSSSCPASNRAELLYLTPPNAIKPPYNTPRAIKEILAHELEHLIHHQQKVRSNGLDSDPDSAYLLEGFGALAQDVTGLQAGNLYVTMAGLKGSALVSLADILNERTRYDDKRDGVLRGAAYLLVRFLYDRAGGDSVRPDGSIDDRGGPSLVKELLRAPDSIAATLTKTSDLSTLIADFYTAWTLPAGASQNACLSFAKPATDPLTGKQRGADPFARFHGMAMSGPPAQPFASQQGSLRPGGVAYFRIDVSADGVQRLGVDTSDGQTLQLGVVRLK